MNARALTLKEAAEMLGISYATAYAHRRELGFFQIGSVWRIWPEKLMEATAQYNPGRPARGEQENQSCPSIGAKDLTSGTSISARQAASELDALLAQPSGKRRRNTATS
ncbi:helix-turn-helix domain-containing protein [Paraburkholderia sp. Ac-20347]|uniref:helix-turn-helix domain-containing protein n=1 Tax=Paraburkholderia sp. Ac-20347 TaxID=2703892 RepID=UPI003217FC73